ncbi:MAG TPA: serine hydrolase [Mycobacteriales bacterium]|nr:serine hydrolase [Mycobacteriales bacterium]
MRARTILALAVGGAIALTAVAAPAGQAATAPPTGTTVGGGLLASTGVVVEPRRGAPPLPSPATLPAAAWMVTNLTTGQVLAAKDPHGRFLPASTLKTLTAATLLPRLNPRASFRATDTDERVDGTRVGLVAGMRYSIAKLFTCMLVMSANDAADALAQANGGIKRTVGQMNEMARRLQADDTHADTPSGLDGPGETTSAYDLALIAQADFAMPAFRRYVQTVRSRVPAPHHRHFMIYTHNDLLTTYHGDIGGKNGYTVAARATYVGAATRHGQTILVTLLRADPIWWPMARDLLNWGFRANGKVAPVGTLVQPLPAPAATARTRTVSRSLGRTDRASQNAADTSARTDRSHPWVAIVIAVIAGVVVVALVAWAVRRRRRRRWYRPRLKLPRS